MKECQQKKVVTLGLQAEIYSVRGMIISLSDLFSMCKIQRNSYFQTRSERLIIIHIKDYINRPPL